MLCTIFEDDVVIAKVVLSEDVCGWVFHIMCLRSFPFEAAAVMLITVNLTYDSPLSCEMPDFVELPFCVCGKM